MRAKTEDYIMKTTFNIMCRILRFIEKSLDDDVFNKKNFTAEYFGISENRFARILDMMVKEGFVSGIEVIDYGEPDEDDPFEDDFKRFSMKITNPSLTVQGIRFQAENTAIIKLLQTAKTLKDLIP